MAEIYRDNPFQNPLFERTVTQWLEEYRNISDLNRFMGTSPNDVIYLKSQKKGAGDEIIFPLMQPLDAKIVEGDNQLVGHETGLNLTSDRLYINNMRFGTKIINAELQEIQMKFSFSDRIRANLRNQAEEFHTRRIISQFALAVANIRLQPFDSQVYAYSALPDLMLNANLDTANAGLSRSRVLIGDDYYATHATITDALQVGNLPVADHKLTVEHIRNAVTLAKTGRSKAIVGALEFTSKENAIRPFKRMMEDGFEAKTFLWLTSPDGYAQLAKDPAWIAQTQRGVIAGSMQPSILGGSSMYKGTVEGVMVLEIPEFDYLTITNAVGNKYVYSALCGASAIGYGMGGRPELRTDLQDYQHQYGLAHTEISGMKVLKFPSKSIGLITNNTNYVEYGMIHSFTTLS